MSINITHQRGSESVKICARPNSTEDTSGWSLEIMYRIDTPYDTTARGITFRHADEISYANWIKFISGEGNIGSKTEHYLDSCSHTDYNFCMYNGGKLVACSEIPIKILQKPLREALEKARESGFKFREED